MTIDTTRGDQIPVAVYGNLRAGYSGYRLLAGRADGAVDGFVDGHELVVDGLPFARPSAAGRLVVEVMWPLPHIYDRVLTDLDRHEGCQPGRADESFYVRVRVNARTAAGEVEAWLYEAGQLIRRRLRWRAAVPSADYAAVRRPAWETVA